MTLNVPDIPVPFYDTNICYELTINPNDRNQYIQDEFRYRKFINYWSLTFRKMANQEMEIHLYPEISECQNLIDGKYPRIHFHGTIKFLSNYSISNFLLKYTYILSKASSVQLNNYRPDYWDKYCLKQHKLMKYLATTENHSYPLIYDNKPILKGSIFGPLNL